VRAEAGARFEAGDVDSSGALDEMRRRSEKGVGRRRGARQYAWFRCKADIATASEWSARARWRLLLADRIGQKGVAQDAQWTEQLHVLGKKVARGSCQFALQLPTRADAAKAETEITPLSDEEARIAEALVDFEAACLVTTAEKDLSPRNPAGLLSPLRVPTFRNLLIEDLVSDIDTFMQNVGAAWLMAHGLEPLGL